MTFGLPTMIGASSGSMNFTAPFTAGQYQFRYFLNDGFTRVATSNTATVGGSAYSVSASPASVAAGGTITVNWTAPAVHSTLDWVGLYQVGAADVSFISWQYTG